MLRTLQALAATACLTTQVAPATAADQTTIPVGSTSRIKAHGVCKKVTNNSTAPIMVPHKEALEWSQGSGSFLNIAAGRNGVTVGHCGLVPHSGDAMIASCVYGLQDISKCFYNFIMYAEEVDTARKMGLPEFTTNVSPLKYLGATLPEAWTLNGVSIPNRPQSTLDNENPLHIKIAEMAYGWCDDVTDEGFYSFVIDHGSDVETFTVRCVEP